mmetsp:Transcript_315/g.943  ORF Transcript_315/g.943 Transcript_315/m.943 type:complete len:202 (-) Transcript_315:881-1486(-)
MRVREGREQFVGPGEATTNRVENLSCICLQIGHLRAPFAGLQSDGQHAHIMCWPWPVLLPMERHRLLGVEPRSRLVEQENVFGVSLSVALLAHVLVHVRHAHLALEEAVRNQPLYKGLALHDVEPVGPRAEHEHVRRPLTNGQPIWYGLEEHRVGMRLRLASRVVERDHRAADARKKHGRTHAVRQLRKRGPCAFGCAEAD